jgi:hypothetical protein
MPNQPTRAWIYTKTPPSVKPNWTSHPRMNPVVTSSTTSYHVLRQQVAQLDSNRPNLARVPPPLLLSLDSQHASSPPILTSYTARLSEEVLTSRRKCKCHLMGCNFKNTEPSNWNSV